MLLLYFLILNQRRHDVEQLPTRQRPQFSKIGASESLLRPRLRARPSCLRYVWMARYAQASRASVKRSGRMSRFGGPWEPAVVADWAGGGEFSAEALLLLARSMFFCSLMPRPTETMIRLSQVDGLLGFLEPIFRLVAGRVDCDGESFDGCGAVRIRLCLREKHVLERGDPRASEPKPTSAENFPWNIWRVKSSLPASCL